MAGDRADAGRAVGDAPTADDLRRTLDEAGIGIWSLDIPTGRIAVSPSCAARFGAAVEGLTTFAKSQERVHPQDRQARSDAIARALTEGGRYDVDYRVRQPGGQVQLDAGGRPARRELAIEVRRLPPGMVEIAVSDTGPDLPPEVAERLFQPFVTTKQDGMGVGLSICKTIIEAHGGLMSGERNAAGGATFRLTLQAAHEGETGRGDGS